MNEPSHDTFPGLDTLRALGAICVLATHTCFWTGQYGKGFLGAASSRLDIGVALFFVLSGFLLSRPFLRRQLERREPPGAGRYFWKRALRIMPLYWITVAIALLAIEQNRGASLGTWVRNLTLTELYLEGGLPAGLTHMWSLTTEVAFYLILPPLMWLFARTICRRAWRPRLLLVALSALVLVAFIWLTTFADIRLGAGQWLPAYLSWFAVGMALAIAQLEHSRGTRHRLLDGLVELAHHPGICWTISAALFAIAVTPLGGPVLLSAPTDGEAVVKNLLYATIAGLLVLPSVLGPRSGTPYSNFMAQPFLRHLGLTSYGVFCLHLSIIHAISDFREIPLFQGRGLELFALTLLVSLLAAEIVYRVVERPVMRLRNVRIGSSKTTAPAAQSETATHN